MKAAVNTLFNHPGLAGPNQRRNLRRKRSIVVHDRWCICKPRLLPAVELSSSVNIFASMIVQTDWYYLGYLRLEGVDKSGRL